LRLEPKEKLGDIILVVSSGPAITIKLKPDQNIFISGMKMSHSGKSEEAFGYDIHLKL
jgi:F-box protein 11